MMHFQRYFHKNLPKCIPHDLRLRTFSSRQGCSPINQPQLVSEVSTLFANVHEAVSVCFGVTTCDPPGLLDVLSVSGCSKPQGLALDIPCASCSFHELRTEDYAYRSCRQPSRPRPSYVPRLRVTRRATCRTRFQTLDTSTISVLYAFLSAKPATRITTSPYTLRRP